MLILDAADVSALYDLPAAFDSVARAAVVHVGGQVQSPTRAALHPAGGEVLVMPASIGAATGVKVWHAFADDHGSIPRSSALILLLDPELGHEVLLDGGIITDLRTGAMSGLAAQRLAPPDARRIGVIGTGIQARAQILALAHALPSVREISVFSRNEERRRAFAARVATELAGLWPERGLEVAGASSPEATCTGRDVVVLATTSSSPVVEDAWLGPEALVIGVGSHAPQEAEIPPATVARARTIAVDTRAGGVDGAGDIGALVAEGVVRRDDVIELGELLQATGEPPRPAVFKSVGFAAADLESARTVARRAQELGRGRMIDVHRAGE